MAMNEIKLEVYADYHQFYIQDKKVAEFSIDECTLEAVLMLQEAAVMWTQEAYDMLLTTKYGTIGIGTARHGYSSVTIKIFDIEPEFLTDEENAIDKINECDIEISSGQILIVGCLEDSSDAKRIELENGVYRARIYYCNLDKISEDGFEGDDFYEVHLWKTNKQEGTKIIKNRNAHS